LTDFIFILKESKTGFIPALIFILTESKTGFIPASNAD